MKRNRLAITGGDTWDDSFWDEAAYKHALKDADVLIQDVAVAAPQLTAGISVLIF